MTGVNGIFQTGCIWFEVTIWNQQFWSSSMKDRQGDFAGAVDAMERCKRIQRRHEAPHWKASEEVHAQMRELMECTSRDDFRRWRNESADLGPRQTALLTGFPRSGTTLLEQLLDAHPQLVSSEERDFIGKELFHTVLGALGKMPLLDALNALPVQEIATQRQRYFRFMIPAIEAYRGSLSRKSTVTTAGRNNCTVSMPCHHNGWFA